MSLQRKLRTVQRAQEMSQNQKSLEDDRNCKPYDDEFHIDLTLQKASSCSEEDNAVGTVSATEVKPAVGDATQGGVKSPASAVSDVQQQQQQLPPPQPLQQQQEIQQQQQQQQLSSCDIVDSPQEPVDEVPKQQVAY